MTPEQIAAIREGHAAGRSQNSIARELGIPAHAISRWSKRTGLLWTGAPAGAEQQATRIKAGRRELAEALIADAMTLRERLHDDDRPDARAVSDLASALERLVRVHLKLDEAVTEGRNERTRSMLSALQEQLEQVVHAEYGEG